MSSLKEALKQQSRPTVGNLRGAKVLLLEQKLNSLFYQMRDTENLEEVRVGLHASAIIKPDSSFCFRQQVLSLFYHQEQGKETPISLLRIFTEGDSIHLKWQTMFSKSGIAVGTEIRSHSKKYDLYFTPDAVIRINGLDYVVEIKSMNTFAYKKANTHPIGEKQCMFYMHLLGIGNGFVLAEDKNTQDFKILPVKYDYNVIAPFIDRLITIQEMKNDFINYKEMPPRKCTSKDCKDALSCGMRPVCWGSKQDRRARRIGNG